MSVVDDQVDVLAAAMTALARQLAWEEEWLALSILDGSLILQVADDLQGGVKLFPVEAGQCGSCKAAVLWGTTKNGKKIPMDPRMLTVIDVAGAFHRGRESHFASCPQSKAWRKGGEKK